VPKQSFLYVFHCINSLNPRPLWDFHLIIMSAAALQHYIFAIQNSPFHNNYHPSFIAPILTNSQPDLKFLLTSSRNDTTFIIPNFDPSNSTDITSDSLQTWGINADGTLTFLQMAPAGGFFPRQFSVNAEGTLAAVGMQYSASVVIVQRKSDGTFGNFVAQVDIPGEITSVVWDE